MGAISTEHITPKGIFPPETLKNSNINLITVPSHEKCNTQFSKDDELFRNCTISESFRTVHGESGWRDVVVPSFNKNRRAKLELLNGLSY
jgi:hypothetical protein